MTPPALEIAVQTSSETYLILVRTRLTSEMAPPALEILVQFSAYLYSLVQAGWLLAEFVRFDMLDLLFVAIAHLARITCTFAEKIIK